jgi:hypothetical protein
MQIYIDEIHTSTKIFKLNPTNWMKKQKWNDYKSAAVLVNNHEAEDFLDSSGKLTQWKHIIFRGRIIKLTKSTGVHGAVCSVVLEEICINGL